MPGVNLLPPELIERRLAEKRVVILLAVIICYIVLLVSVYVIFQVRINQENTYLVELKHDNAQLSEKIAEFKVFEQRKAEASRREKIIETALAGDISWHKLLLKLSFIIPGEVSITGFTGDYSAGIKLNGEARDYISVARWIVRLEEIDELADIWLSGIQASDNEVKYDLSAQFKAALAMQQEQ